MAPKSGLSAQIGWQLESTANTRVTVTSFVPLVSETLMQERERLESEGIISGARTLRSDQWNGGNITIGGDIQLELYNRGLGKLFTAMFGSVTTTSTAGAAPYTHTYIPGDLYGTSKSLTVQVGRPGVGGAVHAFTYAGIHVASWELACAAGEIATLGATVVGMSEDYTRQVTDGVTVNNSTFVTSLTGAFAADDVGRPISGNNIPAAATITSVISSVSVFISASATGAGTGVTVTIGTPLATASYPSSIKPLKYNHGTITVAGTTIPVKELSLKGDNGLADDRRFLGSQYISQPLEADLRTYDGQLTCEFTDLVLYRRFINGDEGSLVANFSSGTDSVTFTCNVRFDGETPQVGGREIVEENLPFKCVSPVSDSNAMSVVLVNSDSTP